VAIDDRSVYPARPAVSSRSDMRAANGFVLPRCQ
jgi:hypothetical protein